MSDDGWKRGFARACRQRCGGEWLETLGVTNDDGKNNRTDEYPEHRFSPLAGDIRWQTA